MSIPVITFFSNKGGVGKTSLVYHVAWMLSQLNVRALVADLDPQGNLSAAFLTDERLEELWLKEGHQPTIFGAVSPLKRGVGDIDIPVAEHINDYLSLISGDMALSEFEDDLSQVWPRCLDRDERAFRVISAFWRVIQKGAEEHQAQVALVDLGPNLGAINRAALIASNYVVMPLGPDLFSLQGLRNLGPTLREWRRGWAERVPKNPDKELLLPEGKMTPIGYIVMQHSVRRDRPVKAYEKWIGRMPDTYRRYVLDKSEENAPPVISDPHCFALVKHYRSLMPMAQEARKPIFLLKPADGALGAHVSAVQDAYMDFKKLTQKIIALAEVSIL